MSGSIKARLFWITIGVVIAIVIREPIAGILSSQIKRPPQPEKLAEPHLLRAERECDLIIGEHLKSLDQFFAEKKRGTRPFADDVLGWASKWRLIADNVPFSSGGRHEKYIRERFEFHIFKPSDLEAAVKQVVSSYLRHVRSIESKMLVDLRADGAEFPSAFALSAIDEHQLEASFDAALARATQATGSDLRDDLAAGIVTFIAGEVLAHVAVRLGVSAGILAAGGATGWATLGVGFVVGLIVDQTVVWVWDWWADPKGNLATDLDKKLDDIHRLIIEGDEEVVGLRARLQQTGRERIAVRRAAVLSLLQPPTGVSP